MAQKPLRILSLDGGGVRGISSLYILKEIMRQIAREHEASNPDDPEISPRPCDYFDLICGTSTGGLIALMIGRLRMVIMGKYLQWLTCSPLMTPFSNTRLFPKKSLAAPPIIQKRHSMRKSSKKK